MRSKTSAAVISAALAAGSILVGAPTASANTYCSSSGYTEGGFPSLRCTKLSNGVLSHGKRDLYPTHGTGVHTTYYKSGGSAVSVRLGYTMSGSTTYSSYFSISSGQTVTRSWTASASALCLSSVGILNYSAGSYQTPAAHC
ncbi:hypothetical protein RND61_08355 [Streptomyces sp. TRM76323]|uniref:Secreted protein n=1 Tax=Streptomyces tamarix TaxID=3078565 RepID=A0ABU3QH31_9ACTN|nr:hypothetical protein [Streptomyces tamarix]MDT9682085.1 hypothetical protein [Streptomyces tamarix]